MAKTDLEGNTTKFILPGLNTNIEVVILPRKFMHSRFGKETKLQKGEMLNGLYDSNSATIYIVRELSAQLKESTLMHELIHHLESQTKHMNEEDKCDIVGAYLLRLYKERPFKKAIKDIIHSKKIK